MDRFRWLLVEPADRIEMSLPALEVQSANPTLSRMIGAVDEGSEIPVRRMVVAAFEDWADKDLCQAYHSTDGQPGNPIADLLAVAAEERNLDL